MIARPGLCIVGGVNRADALIHGNAPGRRNDLPGQGRIGAAVGSAALIRGALEDFYVLDVRRDKGLPFIFQNGRVKRVMPRRNSPNPAQHASWAPIVAVHGVAVVRVGRVQVLKIMAIELHAQRKLSGVAHANNPLRALFVLGEHRQQQRRQYPDNGNDHQQFDERKGGVASAEGGTGSSDSKWSLLASCPMPILRFAQWDSLRRLRHWTAIAATAQTAGDNSPPAGTPARPS